MRTEDKGDSVPLGYQLTGGPHGLGDPDDMTLRKVEKNVLIPKIIRTRSKEEKCANEVKEFHQCCTDTGFFVVFKCRKENNIMKECLRKWYTDEKFIEECTQQYLNERSEFRRTGISKREKKSVRLQSI